MFKILRLVKILNRVTTIFKRCVFTKKYQLNQSQNWKYFNIWTLDAFCWEAGLGSGIFLKLRLQPYRIRQNCSMVEQFQLFLTHCWRFDQYYSFVQDLLGKSCFYHILSSSIVIWQLPLIDNEIVANTGRPNFDSVVFPKGWTLAYSVSSVLKTM